MKQGGTLEWRHNERYGVSNHRRLDCLLSRLFRRRSKNTSKVRGLHKGQIDNQINSVMWVLTNYIQRPSFLDQMIIKIPFKHGRSSTRQAILLRMLTNCDHGPCSRTAWLWNDIPRKVVNQVGQLSRSGSQQNGHYSPCYTMYSNVSSVLPSPRRSCSECSGQFVWD